jgi:leader peptidase (prepilin peptidase)/N-methyltransferase
MGIVMGLFWLIYFGVVMVIDLEHRLIMHPVTLFGMLAALFSGWQLHGWFDTLAGGLGGFGIMAGFYYLGLILLRLIKRRRGEAIDEEEAIGFGDVTLSTVIGLLLGWPGIVGGLILGVLLGGAASLLVLAVALIRRRYHPGLSVAYGPYLALAAIYLLYIQ